MTSWPDVSPPPDGRLAGLVFDDYHPAASAEALELEMESSQGAAYRLRFRRQTFHGRAELFAVHRLRTARLDGRLAGIGAVALKDVEIHGKPSRAAFVFDLRVGSEFRGLGIGRRVVEDLLQWASPRSEIAYAYTMGDNRAGTRVTLHFGPDVGGFAYLVRPAFLGPHDTPLLRSASMDEVHARMRRSGTYDFYANPLSEGRTRAHVASWLIPGARGLSGVSAWSLRGILEEVVVSLPVPLRAVRALLRSLPSAVFRGVRLPEDGEALRSLYLFDLFAPSPVAARDLLRAVAGEARERGFDWLYLPHAPGDPLLAAARADTPRWLSPVIPYRMFARRSDGSEPPLFRRLYVDPRDL